VTLRDAGYDVKVIDRSYRSDTIFKTDLSVDHITCWFSTGALFYAEFNIRLIYKLLGTKADILLGVDSDTLLANTLVSKFIGSPLIIDMHELFTEVPELSDSPVKKSIWKWIEKFGINQSVRRYTVSATVANQYHSRYGKSFDVIRNLPLKINTATSITKLKRFTLVYLGAINRGRGIEELIQAVDKIRDIDLIIYGTGDLYQEIKVLIQKLSLTDRIHCKGWLDPKDILLNLCSAHVGINLLDPSSQSYYFSLANKYFDYIHAGLPSISMNFPEYRSLNAKYQTNILIDDLSKEAIIDAILQMKDNQELYGELKRNCEVAKAAWNWQFESKRLISIFDL